MNTLAEKQTPSIFRFLKGLQSPWTIVVLVPLLVLILDQGNFQAVMSIAIKALISTLPFIAFAVFLIAYLKAAGAQAMIAEAFKGREIRMIVFAAFFGGLAPFCSCEVIPFVAGLLALGAPLSAVMAFWLSSPLIDPPTLFITAAALGWPFAIGKAVAAVALGLFGGLMLKFFASNRVFSDPLKNTLQTGCGCGPSPFDGKPAWNIWNDEERKQTFNSEFLFNAYFLLKWLALAYVLEAILITYVPADLIAQYVGGQGVQPIVVGALVGMPAYLNSYVAPALLAGLLEQGMTIGAAMSFMVAGAVSSIPAMAAVWSLVKARIFFIYLLLGIIGAIMAGAVFQSSMALY